MGNGSEDRYAWCSRDTIPESFATVEWVGIYTLWYCRFRCSFVLLFKEVSHARLE